MPTSLCDYPGRMKSGGELRAMRSPASIAKHLIRTITDNGSTKARVSIVTGPPPALSATVTISGTSVSSYNTSLIIVTDVGATTFDTDLVYESDSTGGRWD